MIVRGSIFTCDGCELELNVHAWQDQGRSIPWRVMMDRFHDHGWYARKEMRELLDDDGEPMGASERWCHYCHGCRRRRFRDPNAEQPHYDYKQTNGEQRKPQQPKATGWMEVLGLVPPCTADEVRAARRTLALKHHPDRGGTPEMMKAINAAADQGMKELEA